MSDSGDLIVVGTLEPDAQSGAIAFSDDAVRAGFPDNVDGALAKQIDFNELLIKQPAATFLMRMTGEAMSQCCCADDIVIVDRSLEAKSGRLVVVRGPRALYLRRMWIRDGQRRFEAESQDSAFVDELAGQDNLSIFGVVTHIIKTPTHTKS